MRAIDGYRCLLACGQWPLRFVISGAFVRPWQWNNAAFLCVVWAGKPGGIGFLDELFKWGSFYNRFLGIKAFGGDYTPVIRLCC